jgi:hypothetical protein
MSENCDNLYYLYPDRGANDGDLPLPVEELAEVVGAIECCLAEISSKSGPGVNVGKATATPLLLRMSAVEQWLGKLDEISVTTWPDARWALVFCNARVKALDYIRASAAAFYGTRHWVEAPSVWGEDTGFVQLGALSRALRAVRDLIVERYPQTRTAC